MTDMKTSVLLEWTREEPTLARVKAAGQKIRFEEGTVREFDSEMAKTILHYKGFVLVTEDKLSKEQLKDLNAWREEQAQEADERQANRERKRLDRLHRVQGVVTTPKGDEEKAGYTDEALGEKGIVELKDVLENEFQGLVEWKEQSDEEYKELVVKAILDAQKAATKTNKKETPAQKAFRLKKEEEATKAAEEAAKAVEEAAKKAPKEDETEEEGEGEKVAA